MPQELVLANFDTEGTTNRSPCNTMHRSPVAHGIGAHWSVGPGVQRARPMSSNNLQKLGSKTTEVVLQLLQSQGHLEQTSQTSVSHRQTPYHTSHYYNNPPVQKWPLRGSTTVFCTVTVMLQKLVRESFEKRFVL